MDSLRHRKTSRSKAFVGAASRKTLTKLKHTPQRCGLAHALSDEDVIQVVKKRNQKELDPHNQKKGPVEKSRNQIKKAKPSLKT